MKITQNIKKIMLLEEYESNKTQQIINTTTLQTRNKFFTSYSQKSNTKTCKKNKKTNKIFIL